MDKDHRKELEDYLDAVESQLNLLESTPLTYGGTFPWTPDMVEQQLFLQNQIDLMENELAEMDHDNDDDIAFRKFIGEPVPAKAIIPKGQEKSDKTYVLGLCDEILGEVSLRDYPYNLIVNYEWVQKKVDAYYMGHNLIVEYDNGFRRKTLPNDGPRVILISYKDFGSSRKIKRDKAKDIESIIKVFGHP